MNNCAMERTAALQGHALLLAWKAFPGAGVVLLLAVYLTRPGLNTLLPVHSPGLAAQAKLIFLVLHS